MQANKNKKNSKKTKKQLTGTVLSSKMQKTVVVGIEYVKKHPLYGKRLKRVQKVYAHSERKVKKGNRVLIQQVRPLSKLKRWRVMEVLK